MRITTASKFRPIVKVRAKSLLFSTLLSFSSGMTPLTPFLCLALTIFLLLVYFSVSGESRSLPKTFYSHKRLVNMLYSQDTSPLFIWQRPATRCARIPITFIPSSIPCVPLLVTDHTFGWNATLHYSLDVRE